MSETPRRYTVDVVNFDEDDSFQIGRPENLTIDTGALARKQSTGVAGTIRSLHRTPSEVSGGETPYSQPDTAGRIRKIARPVEPVYLIPPSHRHVSIRDRFMSMKRLRLSQTQRDNSTIASFTSDMQQLFSSGRQRLRQIESNYSNLI